MRVTNSMLISNSIWNINNNMKRLDKAQQRQSTQSKIQLPSDNPEVATQAVKYRNYVSTVEQYQKNVSDATSWMQVTEGALSDLHDVVAQVRDKTVQASTGTLSDSDLEAIKQEVQQLKKTAIQIMNTSYAGRYVFGGYATDKEPYAESSIMVGSETVDKVTFKGQIMNLGGPVSTSVDSTAYTAAYATNESSMYQSNGTKQSMKYNVGFGNQVTVNVEGQDVVGEGTGSNLFDTFDKLLVGLSGESSYQTVDSSGAIQTTTFSLSDVLGNLDTDLNRLSAITSNLGTRERAADLAANRLSSDDIVYTKLMSKNEDVDIAQATTDVSTAQTVYEASLTAAAKAITKSLLDYIS